MSEKIGPLHSAESREEETQEKYAGKRDEVVVAIKLSDERSAEPKDDVECGTYQRLNQKTALYSSCVGSFRLHRAAIKPLS